jgi:Bacterial alpha-L-rhamnosidase 6 hairpin glycosidase domain/Bacterial alpha-L-rhamnosidase C-terminal domain
MRLAAACCAVVACALAPAALAGGTFTSSDPLLNSIWTASVKTANDGISKPVDLDPRDCKINLPLVILDAPDRDRCPYIGDEAVSGMTLLVAGSHVSTLRAMIAWFASVQNADGSIPASPIFNHTTVLIDYNAYWIEALYDYTLYTGDRTLLKSVFPNLSRLVNVLYPSHLDANGLLVNWLPEDDYDYIDRTGTTVSYYNAQYARALGMAATLAIWDGKPAYAKPWHMRAAAVASWFSAEFWDPAADAFTDSAGDTSVHPQDGNVFAILAGLATASQAQSALAYIDTTMSTPDGDTITDSSAWDRPVWGYDGTSRIEPFIGYFDVLARFSVGDDEAALDLIRREWGFMLDNGPGTMWENIDASTGKPVDIDPSWDHGWSSGAAPALTTQVLGVRPVSPGFAKFVVTPHPGDLTFASGDVPTPHGTIHVSWRLVAGSPVVTVSAPHGTVWLNNPKKVSAP